LIKNKEFNYLINILTVNEFHNNSFDEVSI